MIGCGSTPEHLPESALPFERGRRPATTCLADHFCDVIAKLNKKPAVIGHSFGGLLAQIMAGRGVERRPWPSILPLLGVCFHSPSPH
jgi:pimeloyl-ACP methyl ester carboxylesterase